MTQPDSLSQEIQSLERRIYSLQDYLHEAELYPPQDTRSGRLRRAARLFVIRRAVSRQLHHLQLQRQVALNSRRHSAKSWSARRLTG